MPVKYTPLAIAYDFDGTLSPKNMQEYGFIPALGIKPAKFWKEAGSIAQQHSADQILSYMYCMLQKAEQAGVPVRKNDFFNIGKNITLFEGVESWFKRINEYSRREKVGLTHFIVSSGLREMIEGTKIVRNFTRIYASGFMYDANDVARWPALAINYTTKTQYLFRINKGSLDVHDDSEINKYIPDAERSVPFTNMIYIGDGETDIPCMRLVKDKGGHSIAVYSPKKRNSKIKAEQLVSDGRASLAVPADYSKDKDIDKAVKAIIDIVAARARLDKV